MNEESTQDEEVKSEDQVSEGSQEGSEDTAEASEESSEDTGEVATEGTGVQVLDAEGKVVNTYTGEDALDKANRLAAKNSGWSVQE